MDRGRRPRSTLAKDPSTVATLPVNGTQSVYTEQPDMIYDGNHQMPLQDFVVQRTGSTSQPYPTLKPPHVPRPQAVVSAVSEVLTMETFALGFANTVNVPTQIVAECSKETIRRCTIAFTGPIQYAVEAEHLTALGVVGSGLFFAVPAGIRESIVVSNRDSVWAVGLNASASVSVLTEYWE
jgi:hypothetical protein